ncbi:MAG TPA: shikimate dehydrogenase [Sandaracinaceae bacterium LLY-WYZ-13_1]|nr:shikimate dehydrogenase [Sandaracinaceae bacterium LLY-WYZ-13_1]
MSTADTKLLGVMGWPVAHSRSPAIHSAAIEALGVDAVYVAWPVRPEALPAAIEGLRALGVHGANLTLPHKERAMALLDEVEPTARAIGAVNTIVRDGARLIGTNTDAAGLARSLADAGISLRGARALVIGAGGAARASVAGLAGAGAAEVVVAARRPARADALVRALEPIADGTALHALDLRDAGEAAPRTDLLVQATSATLGEGPEAEALASGLPWDALPADAAVVDLVYAPLETTVLRAAAARGLRTVDGLGMLVHQAALALERWLGLKPPVEAMREAARR